MKSNYKPLGDYIQPVVGRNSDLHDIPLMGLSISKVFIPSIANTIGTDMSTYRVIEKNQFAYGPVTSRNGDKITIALFNDYEKALISQAYIPFEVKDTNELDPEYLMMWFCRPEFDRYARFKSHGSAREIFDWEEMCNVMLPIPSIEKQREIVEEYNTIQNRINLNQNLIQKLEATAQAIYKEWFVDGIDLENLPEGWRIGKLDELTLSTLGGDWGKDISLDNYNQEVFCIRGTDIPTVNIGQIGTLPTRFILSKNLLNRKLNPFDIVIEISGGSPTQSTGRSFFVTSEYLDYIKKDIICSNFCRVIKAKENFSIYLFSSIRYLYNANILFAYENSSNGVKNLAIEDLFIEQIIPIPNDQILNKFNLIFLKYYKHIINLGKENEKLIELKELLLSRLATIEN
jgi:type I restriction enzyme, S subunit